jgi:aryl-alcohol dehydrogenase-like predicted oxidoreductase
MLRKLGNSEFEISPIGLGTWAIGGENQFGWGPQEDAESIAAIHRAVERGINWLDTAAVYGFGHSERIVGRALKELGAAKRPYIFTKCSIVWDEEGNVSHTLDPDSLRNEVEDSLERLEVDVLDLYQIHWPVFPPGDPDSGIEEGWRTLADLKAEGKVREIGVSNFSVAQMERIMPIAPITSLQPPYSILMRGIEDEILPYCEEHGIGVIVYSPMHNGLLSGRMTHERVAGMDPSDWRVNFNPAFKEPHLSRILDFVETLRDIGDRHGRSSAEVAIAWTLNHPAVTAAIVGARNAGQVDGFVAAMDFRLRDDEMVEIEAKIPGSYDLMELA